MLFLSEMHLGKIPNAIQAQQAQQAQQGVI